MQITMTDVCKRYGERVVLDHVNLRIEQGETVALIGPSGGGKSTVLRCLNGLNTIDKGEIRVGDNVLRPEGGARASSAAIREMRRLFGMIFQDYQLFPHMSVLQNVIEAPVRVLGVGRKAAVERAMGLLERVGMASHAHAWPQQLSGGQKQRVAIARALAMEPRGLLCDEITAALDPELKIEVLGVLENLRREGLTVIMVTHEIGFARKAADRVVVLADGKILEDGPPSQVLDNPQTERLQRFLSRVLG